MKKARQTAQYESCIVMMFHDALWVECPEKETELVRHLIRKMMTTAGRLRVPLEVDIK